MSSNDRLNEEEENTENTQEKTKTKILSRKYRFFLFVIIVSIEGATNMSGGLLSSASTVIKKTLGMNDSQFGMFGTSNAIGRFFGCLIFSYLNNKLNRKWFFFVSVFSKACFVCCFKLTTNRDLLVIIRGFIGAGHIIPTIYLVNWIDQYGIKKIKTAQMATHQLVMPLGKCIAFYINTLVGEKNWQLGFLCEGFYLFFTSFVIFISSEDYFSRTLYSQSNYIAGVEIVSREDQPSVFEERVISTNKVEVKTNFFIDVFNLFKSAETILSMICRCVLFGVNTGLHFWIGDYMKNVLHCEDKMKSFFSYTIICLTGPSAGIIANLIFKKLIGGYESKKASWSLVVMHLISGIFGACICFMPNMSYFVICNVMYFLFNSCSTPIIQGILVSTVDKKLAVTCNSLTNLLTQILTSGPTPMLYGIINDKYKEKYPWLAMFCMMSILLLAEPFLIILAKIRSNRFYAESKKNMLNNDRNDEEGKELENK